MKKAILLFAIGFSLATQLLAQTWSTAGNATTTANFIGTTNLMPLNIKINNRVSGIIDPSVLANTAFGYTAFRSVTSGSFNAAFGANSLGLNTTGNANTAIGYSSLASNTTGYNNTATGYQALAANTTGNGNTATGEWSLFNNTIGGFNTSIGYWSMYYNTTGANNTSVGQLSMYYNTSGVANVGVGDHAVFGNTTGIQNVGIGDAALYWNTTGNNNTGIGNSVLMALTSGSNNTAIGCNASPASLIGPTITNWNAIGYNCGGTYSTSNSVELGNSSIATIRAQVTGITAYSDARVKDNVKANVKGLDFINRLRPVTYNLNIHRENDIIYKNKKQGDADFAGKYDIEKLTQTGFIAQEVEKAAIESGYDFTGVEKPNTPDGLYSVRYTDFIMPIVKSVQELSATNEQLKKQNEELQTQIDELRAIMHDIQHSMTQCCPNYQISKTSSVQTTDASQEPSLTQNFPNPFTMNTLIRCTIPGNFNSATIKVSTITGSEVMTFPVHQTGTNEFTIQSGTLSAGMYQYSLIIDGKMIDTKKMVLTK